LMELSDLLCLF